MNLIRKKRHVFIILAACCLFLPTILSAETATFDGLEEGMVGNELTDGEITFFNLDNGHPDIDNVFIIEQADETLSGPSFSTPNGLTASGYTPGAHLGYGAIKEMSMSTIADADSASIEVFTTGTQLYDNTVTLEAIKEGAVVESVSVAIRDLASNHFTLTLDGIVFDTLRLVSSPNAQVLFLDNVTINTIPMDSCECDIVRDGACDMNDWRLFGQDWGRDDCTGAEDVCECDLDQNGACDMNDWRLFGRDWGRDDCP